MKTEEDEAFDDLARRQGMWGGGFTAKRQMAADKLRDGKCKLCVDGCIACDARAQPAQEPVAWAVQGCSKMWRGEFAEIDAKAEAKRIGGTCVAYALYTAPPKRKWVGLTDEDRKAALITAYKEWECEELLLCAREDYLLIEQALMEKNT